MLFRILAGILGFLCIATIPIMFVEGLGLKYLLFLQIPFGAVIIIYALGGDRKIREYLPSHIANLLVGPIENKESK